MPSYLVRRLWWQRLLILAALALLFVAASTALLVFGFLGEATSWSYVLGNAVGNLAFVSVLVAGNVLSRWRADARWKAVRKIEPDALLQEFVLDAPTSVSLSRLGVLDSVLSVSRFHAGSSALTVAFSPEGIRIYAGVRVARKAAEILWSDVEAVKTVRVRRNGGRTRAVLRFSFSNPADTPHLFFTVGSSRWLWLASERQLDDLAATLQQYLRGAKLPETRRKGSATTPLVWMPFGSVLTTNAGYGARTYFNRYQVLVGILGSIYVTGWVNSFFVFLTRDLPPFVSGVASSYSNVFVFGLILAIA